MDKEWNKSKKQRNLQGLIIEFLPREIYINKREFRSFVRMSVTIFSPSLRGSWIFLFSWVISPCFDRLQGFLNIPVDRLQGFLNIPVDFTNILPNGYKSLVTSTGKIV